MAKISDSESKSLKPEGLEDKSIAPDNTTVENKAVTDAAEVEEAANRLGRVHVVFAHPVREGRIGNDKPISAGDKQSLPKTLATNLIQQGVARLAD